MSERVVEIRRAEAVGLGRTAATVDTHCVVCGRRVRLWFNGGELDFTECCGLRYELEPVRVDLVVYRLT